MLQTPREVRLLAQQSYEPFSKAPKDIRTAANIALLCGAASRLVGIASSTIIIVLLPTWVPGILALQPIPVALLITAISSYFLAKACFRNRERIALGQYEKARSSSLLGTVLGLIIGGIVPGILNLFLYTRTGSIMVRRKPDPTTVYLLPQPSEGIFLGRYLGWIAGYILVLYVGYTQLPRGLEGVNDWLAPVFGVHFNTIMVTAYLVLANPLTYTPLLQLWAAVGFLSGLIAGGRVGRGFTVGMTIFFSTLGAMGLASMAILRGFSFATFANIPPPPPGFSLGSLATGPVAQDLLPIFLGGTSLTDPALLQNLALTLLRNILLVLAIVTIAARAGCLAWQGSMFLGKRAMKMVRARPRSRTQGKSPVPANVTLALMLLALALLIPFQNAGTTHSTVQAPPAGPYQQNLAVGLDMLGTPNASLRLTNLDLTSRGLQLDTNYDNNNLTMLIINNNYSQAFGTGPQSFLLRLFSEPTLVEFFTGNSGTAAKADAIAGQFSQALGVGFSPALTLPVGPDYVRIYSPTASLSNLEALTRVLGILPPTGFSSLVTPAGLGNKRYFAMLGLLPPVNGRSIRGFSFSLDIQYPRAFYKEAAHQLSLKTLLGFQNSLTGDTAANVSIVTLAFQKGTVLYSPLGPNPYYDNNTYTYNYDASTSPTPDLSANFYYPFAPNIIIRKTVTPTTGPVGTTHTVTVRVVSLDSDPVDNLNITDTETTIPYLGTLKLSPAGSQTSQLATLASLDTQSLSYKATTQSSGTYVLSPATVDFLWTAFNGTKLRYTISTEEIVIGSSSGPTTQFTTTINDLWPYSILLGLFLVLTPIWHGSKWLLKRRREARRRIPPPPVPTASTTPASPNPP